MKFLRMLAKKIRSHYTPHIEVRIFKDRIIENVRACESRVAPARVAPVLKSNAYGHGLYEVAHVVDALFPPFIIVDSYYEALMLRYDGVKSPLLVIGYTPAATIHASRAKNTSYTIISVDEARELAGTLTRPTTVHIKIDTGMHRQGIAASEFEEVVRVLNKNSAIRIEGVCSHFADADSADESFTNAQILKWNECVAVAKKLVPSLRFFHVANTAGVRYAHQCDANVVRVGIGLYDRALEMRTVVASVREVQVGEKIGYHGTFTAERPMKLATIPAGYYEGIDRRLSNCGFVEVTGVMCPIVGRVSMNITIVDVSAIADVAIGTPVVVVSADANKENSFSHMALLCDTIPYELMVHVPSTLHRFVV